MAKRVRESLAAGKARRLEDEGDALLCANLCDDAIIRFDLALTHVSRSKRALKGKIIALRKSGEFDRSKALIDEALSHYPRDPYFLVERGWLAFDRRAYGEAVTGFNETLREDDKDEGALQGKAAALRCLRDFRTAENLLAEAIKTHPRSAGLLTERGWLWIEQSNYPKAADAFKAALEVDQPDDSVYLWQLFVLRQLGRLDEADALLKQALENFPDSLRLGTEAGWLLFYRRDYAAAVAQFSAVLSVEPSLATALQGKIAALRLSWALEDAEYELARNHDVVALNPGLQGEKGWTAFAREDFASAERAFREVVDNGGSHLDRVNLAWALLNIGDEPSLKEAAELCRESLLIAKSAEAFGCLGVVSFRQKKIDEAEIYLKNSIETNARMGHHADLGSLYAYMLRYEEAEKVLQQGIAIKPGDVPLHIESANLRLLRNQPEEAAICFRRALRLDPKNLDAATGLATSLLAAGKAADAETVVRENIGRATGAKRAGLLLMLAKALCARFDISADTGLLAQAMQAVGQTRQLRPATAESFFQEGVIQTKLGQYRDAYAAFVKCQKMDSSLTQASLNASQVRLLIKEERKGIRFTEAKSWILFLLLLGQLLALWHFRLQNDKLVNDTLITVLVPICLGLMIVAFLMPSLTKFSVTGIAVELAPAPSAAESKGPKGKSQADETLPAAGPAI